MTHEVTHHPRDVSCTSLCCHQHLHTRCEQDRPSLGVARQGHSGLSRPAVNALAKVAHVPPSSMAHLGVS